MGSQVTNQHVDEPEAAGDGDHEKIEQGVLQGVLLAGHLVLLE